MTVETASDRKAFLADFGINVTFRPQSSGAKTVKGIFDNIYQEIEAGGSVGISMQQPRLFCVTSDIVGATEGDIVKIDSTTYIIRVVMSDGIGMTELMLEKQ
ncbi:MAG: head-tail joining protein [bacterium]